jgi:hydrogenase nickel incorporation protein HypB
VSKLNGAAPIFPMSATKGDGVDAWAEWLAGRIDSTKAAAAARKAGEGA